jgi:hypothetical protein
MYTYEKEFQKKKRKKEKTNTVTALCKVEHVSDFDGHGPKETLVVALEFALIKDLYLDVGGFLNGTEERMSE